MHVLITCKYETDPIKNSQENVLTKFSPLQVAQRATIAQRVQCAKVKSHLKTYKWAMEIRGPKSNSSKLLCLSWLPATLMMIQSKMNKLAWRPILPLQVYRNFFRTQGQLTP